MRLILGIILGVLLTTGVAYIADYGRRPVCPAGGVGCPLVNWDEANSRFDSISAGVQSAWHRLIGRERD